MISRTTSHQRCFRCVMDTSGPEITFDTSGVCSHVGCSTNFSGQHRRGDTVFWNWHQICAISSGINATQRDAATVPARRWYGSLIRLGRLLGRRTKYFANGGIATPPATTRTRVA